MIDRFKAACARAWAWCGRQYRKLVAFLLTLLVGVGVVSYAETRDITFTPPTQRVDGTAIPEGELAEHRLYCNGSLTDTVAMPGTVFSNDFGLGRHDCYATAVNIYGDESDPSESVTFTVTPAKPEPPTIQLQ